MYSLVVFGCPATTIRPSRSMSTPTEIMLDASTTSYVLLVGVRPCPAGPSPRLISPVLSRLVSSSGSATSRLREPRRFVRRANRHAFVLLCACERTSSSTRRRIPPSSRRALKYPTRVMYASRLCRRRGTRRRSFCAAQSSGTYVRSKMRFMRVPRRRNAHIQATGIVAIDHGEERLERIDCRRRKHARLLLDRPYKRADLIVRVIRSRRRRDDLRADEPSVHFAATPESSMAIS